MIERNSLKCEELKLTGRQMENEKCSTHLQFGFFLLDSMYSLLKVQTLTLNVPQEVCILPPTPKRTHTNKQTGVASFIATSAYQFTLLFLTCMLLRH